MEEAATPRDEGDLSPWRAAGLKARSRRRRMLLGVLIALVLSIAFTGFPTGREMITGWLLLTLLAACGGDVLVWRRAVVRDWLPLLAVLFAYDLLRGLADEVGGALFGLPTWRSNLGNLLEVSRAHLTEPLAVDKALFGGTVPTIWLQQRFFDVGQAHWYDRIAVPVYLSHFLVSLALAIVLWCVSYRMFRRYLATFVTLTLVTLATYLFYPAAPPWMAGLNNKLPEVHRVVQETLSLLGGTTVNSAVERGSAYSNPVAAMPSLHAAIPMMLLLFFWPEVGRRGRALLALYTGLMAITLVYGGEHYVTDVLVGWTYSAACVFGVRHVADRRERAALGARTTVDLSEP